MSSSTNKLYNEVNNVEFGVKSFSADREFATLVATRQKATWPSTAKIMALEITVVSETTGAGQNKGLVNVCFDAPSDAVANSWLTSASHLTDDAESIGILVGETRRISFAHPITRMDAIRAIGGQDLKVKVKAEAALDV